MFEFSPSAIESSRFQAWVYCVFFSMVCLVSHVTFVAEDYKERFRNQEEWTTAALSISMVLSLVASVALVIAKKHFESSVAEGGLAVLLLIVWVCALPFIMDFENHLAINSQYADVRDANLFVFSWVSFMCVLLVVHDFAKEKAKENNLLANNDNASKVAKWFGLAVIAVVLVASASDLFHLFECRNYDGEPWCRRLAFAIALGAITFLLSMALGIFSMRSVLTTKIESSAAILALILHIFGIIFLTLGNLAPGNFVGNLFFSTWVSFFFSALLTRQCLGDLYKQHTESADVSSTEVVDGEDTVEVVAGEKNDIENVERATDDNDDDGHNS